MLVLQPMPVWFNFNARLILHLLLVMFFLSTLAQPLQATPKARLIPFWNKSDELNKTSIDHSGWGKFLRQYARAHTDGINRVDYARVTAADKEQLDSYIKSLKSIAIRSYNRNEQFAYWVNLYNAATVQLVLANFPIKSITKISFGLFSFGPWDEPLLKIEQQHLSLNDIEHGILRPIWRDRRIHYVVNCASMGCPNLLLKPFSAMGIEAQLAQAEGAYIDHPRGLRIEGNTLHLSKIFSWYASDFAASESELAASLIKIKTRKFAADDEKALEPYKSWQDLSANRRSIRYSYDWALNKP